MLALCQVGKYLFSDNLAAFLHYLCAGANSRVWGDVVTTCLIILANVIIWGPISSELRKTKFWDRCCVKKEPEDEESLALDE